jgi:hypothetical protein
MCEKGRYRKKEVNSRMNERKKSGESRGGKKRKKGL